MFKGVHPTAGTARTSNTCVLHMWWTPTLTYKLKTQMYNI